MENNEIKKVAIYLRVSTPNQVDRGTIEVQRSACKEFCKGQGWEIEDTFRDPAESGNVPIDERPNGRILMQNIKDRKYDAVVAFALDRLTRSEKMAERGYIYDTLGENDTAFGSVTEGVFYCNDLIGDVTYSIRSAVAKEEREKINKRMGEGRKEAVKKNHYAMGGVPYGIRWHDHDLVDGQRIDIKQWKIHDREYEVLKKMVLLLKEGFGCKKVSQVFNSDLENHPPKKPIIIVKDPEDPENEELWTEKLREWAPSTIWRFIESDILFTGKTKLFDTGIKLFSQEEITGARFLMRQKKRTSKGVNGRTKPLPTEFLLHRLLKCGCCDRQRNMGILVLTTKYQYYKCSHCGAGFNARKVDLELWEKAIKVWKDPVLLRQAIQAEEFIPDISRKGAEIELVTVRESLEDLEKKKDRNNDLFIRGILPPVKYETYRMEFEQEEQELQDKLRRLENSLAETNLMAASIDKAVEIVTKQVDYLGNVKIPKVFLEENDNSIEGAKEFMDYIKGRKIAKMESGIVDLKDVRKLIFQQKRQILNKVVLAGGRITAYNDPKRIEIETDVYGSLQGKLYRNFIAI